MARSRLGSELAVIERDDGQSLYVPVRYGFAELIDTLSAAAPHVEIRDA